jgi:hypothetical protein
MESDFSGGTPLDTSHPGYTLVTLTKNRRSRQQKETLPESIAENLNKNNRNDASTDTPTADADRVAEGTTDYNDPSTPVYCIKIRTKASKGSKVHRPMILLQELLETLQKTDEDAAIMPFLAADDDPPLTGMDSFPAHDKDGLFTKVYMTGLRTQDQWLHARILIRSTTSYQDFRKNQAGGLLTWLETYDGKIDLDIATSTRTVRAGFFVLVDASHRSVPTFTRLLHLQCPELSATGIPHIIRTGYRTSGLTGARANHPIFEVACDADQVAAIATSLTRFQTPNPPHKWFIPENTWAVLDVTGKQRIIDTHDAWRKSYQTITIKGIQSIDEIMSVTSETGGIENKTIQTFISELVDRETSSPLFQIQAGTPCISYPFLEYYVLANTRATKASADSALRWGRMAANVLVPMMTTEAATRSFTSLSLRHINVTLQPTMTGMKVPSQIEFQFMTLEVPPEEDPEDLPTVATSGSQRRRRNDKKRKTVSRMDFSSTIGPSDNIAATPVQRSWGKVAATTPPTTPQAPTPLPTNLETPQPPARPKASQVSTPFSNRHSGQGYPQGDDQLSQISQTSQITQFLQTMDNHVSTLTASIDRNTTRINEQQAQSIRAQENYRLEMAQMQAQFMAQNANILALFAAQRPTGTPTLPPNTNTNETEDINEQNDLSMSFAPHEECDDRSVVSSTTGLNTTMDEMDLDTPSDPRPTKRDPSKTSNLANSPALQNLRSADSRTNTRLAAPYPPASIQRTRNNQGRRSGS